MNLTSNPLSAKLKSFGETNNFSEHVSAPSTHHQPRGFKVENIDCSQDISVYFITGWNFQQPSKYSNYIQKDQWQIWDGSSHFDVLVVDSIFSSNFPFIQNSVLKTVTPAALYEAFQSEVGSDYNITETMGSWITKPGYPILNVNVANDRKRIVVTQNRFLRNNRNHQDKSLWNVPLTYASSKENSHFSGTKPITLLTNKSLEINLKEPVDWIIFNVQQTGVYLNLSVNYFNGFPSNFEWVFYSR